MNAPRARVARRPVHGVLLLDKPLGLSSNDALQKVKWLLRAEKAGHTGTLDPLASGVLPLCFGAATKFSQLQLDADKRYEAVLQLGIKTSTGDAEGDVTGTRSVLVSDAMLRRAALQLTGPISQVPPMHSALKKDGKALYEYARAGVEVERDAREVVIHELSVELCGDVSGAQSVRMRVLCSKGTYIRTLGEDLAGLLGCDGHLSMLRRTATGGFDVSQSVTVPALEAMSETQRMACLLPVDSLLTLHTAVSLDADHAQRFLSGLRRRGGWPDTAQVAVYGEQPAALLGSAHIRAGELIPTRLLNPPEIEQCLAQWATAKAETLLKPCGTDRGDLATDQVLNILRKP